MKRKLTVALVTAVSLLCNSCLDYEAAQLECHEKGFCVTPGTGGVGADLLPRQGIGAMAPSTGADLSVVGDGFEQWEQSCAGTDCVVGGISP